MGLRYPLSSPTTEPLTHHRCKHVLGASTTLDFSICNERCHLSTTAADSDSDESEEVASFEELQGVTPIHHHLPRSSLPGFTNSLRGEVCPLFQPPDPQAVPRGVSLPPTLQDESSRLMSSAEDENRSSLFATYCHDRGLCSATFREC